MCIRDRKTPIATIQTVADVALSGDDADLRPAVAQIRKVNARNAATVSSLLQLANVQVRDRGAVDLAALCHEAVAAHCVPVDAEPVTVEASPTLVRQAVDNLVRNAVAHGAPGTAQLTLQRASGTPAPLAEITVSSGGDVLDPAEVATWTEPFTRARRTAGSGHGLGLALVKAIAKAHGGSVELSPRAGGGLAVRLLLPA